MTNSTPIPDWNGTHLFARPSRRVRAAMAAMLLLATAAPARADFFDGVRRTFQTDIPHFFQDDIPCAFGGQPTSHTRTSCKSSGKTDKRAQVKPDLHAPPTRPNDLAKVPPPPPLPSVSPNDE